MTLVAPQIKKLIISIFPFGNVSSRWDSDVSELNIFDTTHVSSRWDFPSKKAPEVRHTGSKIEVPYNVSSLWAIVCTQVVLT
ncbi:MAG: hypothetical protein AAF573_03250 [Bacteroidota bacterium]